MHIETQPGQMDDGPLSPWWIRSVLAIMVVGFALLLGITGMAYQNAPPIPERVVDPAGSTLFSGDDIREGQAVFLKYGLMNNGSIWGHGGYLGPDFSALALHRIGVGAAHALAQQVHGQPYEALERTQRAAIDGQVAALLKTNRYDAASGTLQLTDAEAAAWQQEAQHWAEYFRHPGGNGGLKPDLITDAQELRQFSAFVNWAAWASAAERPGTSHSYTNNFPYDPLVGNHPTGGTLLWSALSLIALLGGISSVLLAFGKFDYLGWVTRGHRATPMLVPGQASPAQRALVKFFVVVGLLFVGQTLIGGALAHYRTEPDNFYGLPLELIFPSNLMRTWHLQTAVFWIATAYVGAALFLARSLRRDEPAALVTWINLLFVAFGLVIFGSLLGEWAGIAQWFGGDLWFWIGNQGWEFLELGRLWQFLLIVGLFAWFALLLWLTRPQAMVNPDARPIVRMFLWASLAIPVFYIPAVFFGARTNFTVVDTWRFWIIHLWVEGFFEFFATTVIALVLYQMGLARRNTALRVIYLDAILYFGGGLLGTGHHWYFTGQTHVNMAISAVFSALEVVPLTLLTLDAWDFVRTTRGQRDDQGVPIHVAHKWTFYFLMAVGFWNFLGAGVFGFLINLPIVSYYEVGTILTPNHGHAALMGVFGMLALAMMTLVLRQVTGEAHWPGVERWVKIGFWGANLGLAMMLAMSLFPGGLLQVWDVLQNGYWHARSTAYTLSPLPNRLEWMRLPGDAVFIFLGSVPMLIASVKAWLALRHSAPAQA